MYKISKENWLKIFAKATARYIKGLNEDDDWAISDEVLEYCPELAERLRIAFDMDDDPEVDEIFYQIDDMISQNFKEIFGFDLEEVL
jgi:hypothetical protein